MPGVFILDESHPFPRQKGSSFIISSLPRCLKVVRGQTRGEVLLVLLPFEGRGVRNGILRDF